MPISGIGVSVQPELAEKVKSEIREKIDGDVFAAAGDRLVVVLETGTTREAKNMFEEINRLSGVINTWIAYHNVEDL